VSKPIAQWSKEYGFKRGILESRLKNGWTVKEAIETPRNTILKPRKSITDAHKRKISESMLKHFSQ